MRKKVMVFIATLALLGVVLPASGVDAQSSGKPSVFNTHRPAVNPHRLSPATATSYNWAGYVAEGTTFKYVTANYSVPSVNCATTPNAFSYHWVGLDGWGGSTVEQDGVGSFCANGSPFYFAWAWMYGNEGEVASFNLSAGDAITSSVAYNTTYNYYTLKLTDTTTGQVINVNESCTTKTCNNASAEVISEAYPSGSYQGWADFSQVRYDQAKVNTLATNVHTTFGSSAFTTLQVTAQEAHVDCVPSPLYKSASTLSGFDNTWKALT